MITLFVTVFASLFSVVNPLGAMPIFLAMTRDEETSERNRIARNASFYLVIILVFFFFVGIFILDFFGISINAMRIAGGLIILDSGYNLLTGNFAKGRTIDKKVRAEADQKDDISLTPLAIPMLAGPGSISLLISLFIQHNNAYEIGVITLVIAAVGLATYIVLRVSPQLFRFLGQAGLNSISRILGFLVMAIGIQYMIRGITDIVLEF